MTSGQYQSFRRSIGSQERVAKLLGISRFTIIRRERGKVRFSKADAMAIQALAKKYAPGRK